LWQFEALDLDESVLLRSNTFTLGSVVVSAWLSINLGIDGITFSKLHLVSCFQGVELPSNEGIIEWIHFSGDE